MARLRIDNKTARQLWLHGQGLGPAPTGPVDLAKTIADLGFVQLDSIQVVARAHHHILWSRNQNYREPMLDKYMSKDRGVFEHFTHDASVIPMQFLPMWRRQFRRMTNKIDRAGWYKSMPDAAGRAMIRDRIAAEGALCSGDFDTKVAGKKEMWSRPPHKLALDYMWYGGELATCHRKGFTKFYDLGERIFPRPLLDDEKTETAQINWLCDAALSRMGFGSLGEVHKFWEATDRAEVAEWAERSGLQEIEVQSADGDWTRAVACADINMRIEALTPATSRLRILNPFDPAIRDRIRLERLFGFEYRVEMFVPAAKRQWGYYVYPLLEGDRFVGRIEVKADRKTRQLNVINLWQEPKVKWSSARQIKLEAELDRLARFVGADAVTWP